MAQLKMYWLKGTEIKEQTLPEGYSVTNYKDEADKAAWVECCRDGLIGDDAGTEAFDLKIEQHSDINLLTDVFFLDYMGEHIATATAIFHPAENCGELHMVGMRSDFRGKGLAKYLNYTAVKKLDAQGVDYIYLTTDEWRKGAVKSYLGAGFVPVKYDEGMEARWRAVLTEYNIDTVGMVNEDCSLYKTIHRDVKIGVFGAGRGKTMMEYCAQNDGARLVAVCDGFAPALENAKKDYGGENISFYNDFDNFINHDMDAVVLANYANEHAPFAIKCLDAGLNVLSEVLPVQTMKEAVALVEAVERSGRLYAYAENYCFMPAPKKMRELYREGILGKLEYGEGEYMHNCEPGWHRYTRGLPEHWRNTMHSCYYCTHSIGPLIHISGLRPVKVMGFETYYNNRMYRMGAKAAPIGMEIITLENGAALKSIHGVGPAKNSVWYSVYGSKGRMESAREDAEKDGAQTLYVNCDENEGDNSSSPVIVDCRDALSVGSQNAGHGGSDFYIMHNFVNKFWGDPDADVIDVYEAMDMFLPGMFAYRSILEDRPLPVPNLRDISEREKWRNDTACTDPDLAGEMLLPVYSKGTPDIPAEVYERNVKMFKEFLEENKN